jgi:hypothetical protein
VQSVAWKMGKGRDTVRRTVSVGRDWSSVTTAIETPLIRDLGPPTDRTAHPPEWCFGSVSTKLTSLYTLTDRDSQAYSDEKGSVNV